MRECSMNLKVGKKKTENVKPIFFFLLNIMRFIQVNKGKIKPNNISGAMVAETSALEKNRATLI